MLRVRWFSVLLVSAAVAAIWVTASAFAQGASSRASSTPSGGSTHRELVKLSVNTASTSVQWADLYAAIDEGFFAKHGLDVTPILSKSEPGTVLISGQAQITTGSPTSLYIADAQNANIKAIYSMGATYVAWVAKKDIRTPKDLEGKTLGVFSLQDLDVIYTAQMMKQYGISPGSYTLLAVGPSSDKLAAVKAGSVATAPLYPPTNFQAKADGLRQIFDTSQLKGGAIPGFYIVRQSWGKAHKAEVVSYIKALNEAHQWLFNPKNKRKVISVIRKHTQLPAKIALQSYNLFFRKPGLNYSKAGEWKSRPVKAMEPSLIKLKLLSKSVPYASTVDLSYLRAATKGR